MSCAQFKPVPREVEDPLSNSSWNLIAEAIRLTAMGKAVDEAVDLRRWADLLEGIGELHARTPR